MRTSQKITSRNIVIAAIVIASIAAVISIAVVSRMNGVHNGSKVTDQQSVIFDIDHPTYDTASQLAADSDVILTGSVLDSGKTKTGPAVVETEFTVKVHKSFKGNVQSGDTITVVLTGGTVDNVKYVSKEMPWMLKGDSRLMYLHVGDDGKYYPMAGGAALASPKTSDSKKYALPDAVSGKQKLEVTESEL